VVEVNGGVQVVELVIKKNTFPKTRVYIIPTSTVPSFFLLLYCYCPCRCYRSASMRRMVGFATF
jgi:hypothetical protein